MATLPQWRTNIDLVDARLEVLELAVRQTRAVVKRAKRDIAATNLYLNVMFPNQTQIDAYFAINLPLYEAGLDAIEAAADALGTDN